jgi:hypothetical protein
MPNKHEPKRKREERKIAHTSQHSKKERGMTMEYTKLKKKYSTHLHKS